MPTEEIAVPITVAIFILKKYGNDDNWATVCWYFNSFFDKQKVTLIFMGLYIFGGAALFHAWEGDHYFVANDDEYNLGDVDDCIK